MLIHGTKLGRYEIRAKIGEGGMGEVYLAQDMKLDRKVALKILPPDVAADGSRMNRFVQEAKAASALNHPNIITIYEIDETDSGHFIATEFIDGQTLRERLRKEPLSVSEALDVAAQVAAALAAAHQAGIIHRDIKPENTMVRADGLVKVLDFGLAKLTAAGASDPEGATRIQSDTQPGMIMGTVAYMSPEQARGQTVDTRTDVWSLGVLLYEMLSHRTPFRGDTASDTLANILHREPNALNIGALSGDLAKIIERMLAKELAARYPTMAAVLSDLKSLQRRVEFDSEMQLTSIRSVPTDGQTRVAGPTSLPETSSKSVDSAAARADEGFWVAVLPFKAVGSSVEIEVLASGLTEEIVTGMSRFSYLRVMGLSSTARHAETGDVRATGKELGARYVMDGSVRQAGPMVRVAAQLVDAITGAHLWAETYDRQFQADQIFAMQDDLVPRIVSTCGDHFGVLARSISDAVRGMDPNQLTPYEALMRGFGYHYRLNPEEHADARSVLERAVEQSPNNADCWAMLSWTYSHEYGHGFNPRPGPLDRALAAARRAVDLAPSNHLAYMSLAVALFFRKEKAACLSAAERSMALNALDASGEAIFLITLTGDWERGCSLIRHAMELNPHHPDWYRLVLALNEYRQGNYREAVEAATRANIPGVFWTHIVLAAAHGQLDEMEAAREALRNLLTQKPEYAEKAREELGKWFEGVILDHWIEGLKKAGLSDAATRPSFSVEPSQASAGVRVDEGFWIAVLPFKFAGSNTEVATLAEGLSEEIVTGLSRFSYLRVISRSSTLRYAKETDDVRDVGKTLGARYVMDGSLRVAGSSLRISVQLIDADTGAHLWADTYDRQFRAEEVFALQDDLVPRIVSTVADVNGVLPRSMSEVVCARNPDELSPYEAVLRSFRYFDRVTAEELAAALSCLEIAVQKAPTNPDAWAMLALLFVQDYGQGFNLDPDALNSGARAAQRAVEAGPSSHLAHFSLAQARFFQKDIQSFRNAAERAVALNPMDANSLAFIGELLTYVGDSERGLALASRAKQINPNHPGWFWYADFFHAYRQGDYRGALDLILKTNLPGHWGMHAGIAAAAGQLADTETAGKAVRDLLKLRPDYGATVHNTLAKWFDPELCEQLLDGLRKAGLEILEHQRLTSSSAATETTPLAKSSPSIAVLPFANLSNDPDNDYFCDGLAEELLNALTKIDQLKVAARTSAFSFKGKDTTVSEIGQKLSVNSVLEGSVRRSGNRLRITVQLVNASDGYHLWSERYDRELRDVFDVQDEITLAVVDALRLKLFGAEKAAVLKRYTDNVEAHELFLKGRYHHFKYTAEGWKRAIEFFEKAIEIEPSYAPAYAAMTRSWGCLLFFGLVPSDVAIASMKPATAEALKFDETLAEAHLSSAMVTFFYDWEWRKAEEEFRWALDLNPSNAEVCSFYSMFLALEDRFDEAIAQSKQSLALDPLSPLINMNAGWTYFTSGLMDKALEQVGRMIEIEPGFYGAYWLQGAIYLTEGSYEKAVDELKRAVALGGHQTVLADLGSAYALARRTAEAEAVLNQLLERRQHEYVSAICIARVYCRLGQTDRTIEWLEKAFAERNGEMLFLKGEIEGAAKNDPLIELDSDPRVAAIFQKMNLAKEKR